MTGRGVTDSATREVRGAGMPPDGARVLLTGATGFVGASLARRLLTAHGCDVHAAVREGGGDRWRMQGIEDDITWHIVDLLDPAALTESVERISPDVIYHLATYYAVDQRGVDLSEMVDVNVKAGLNVVLAAKAAPDLRLLVNVGTCAEYGDLRDPATEESPLEPNSIYASTKAAGGIITRQMSEDEGVPMTTLRLYNMYGPFEKARRLVPHVILSLLRGEHVPLTGGEQAKDYTYIEDIVDAFVAAASRPTEAAGRVLNIGSGTTVPMRELVDTIAGHFDGGADLLGWGEVPYRDNEMWFQGTRIDAAQEVLGWSPAHDLNEGLAQTVAWYRENQDLYVG